MLKWAVNGPRQTYLQSDDQLNLPSRATQTQRRRLKRKSSDACMMRPKNSWYDKENQFTSTPLHPSARSFSASPSRKMDSLIDLSNIVPDFTPFVSAKTSAAHKNSPKPTKTPMASSSQRLNKPNTYASTLPTFDVEYSPCALIPGPLLALRGVGIPDSYFEKPRYLTPHPQQMASSTSPPEECLETKTFVKPKEQTLPYPNYMEESSLSSSKMGDVTLERMIDAILESTRKERKPPKPREKHNDPQTANMSPTYTPADDPASDLHEVWDSEKARYQQKEQKFRERLTKKCLFNEREICSPHCKQQLDPGQLRRQGGVRRKRKITKLTNSVMNSAQKLLGKASQQTPFFHSHNLRKVFEADRIQDEVHPQKLMRKVFEADRIQDEVHSQKLLRKVFEDDRIQDEGHPQKLLRNLSPDSGHNSSSEYEEEVDNDLTLGYKSEDNKTFDVTKRRLSFSLSRSSDR